MKKGMAPFWIVAITALVAIAVSGGAGYYIYNEYSKDVAAAKCDNAVNDHTEIESSATKTIGSTNSVNSSTVSIDTSSWKTSDLKMGNAKIKYPGSWTISENSNSTAEWFGYDVKTRINDQDTSGSIDQYDISEWLKGPGSDDGGYVMANNNRKAAYQTLSNIYNDRKLSPASRMELNNYYLEFFTYSNNNRGDVKYIESSDGKWRGFTMINTQGQDVGLTTDYKVSLYNKEKNIVTSILMPIGGEYTEIKQLRNRYGDYKQSNDQLTAIDRDVHQDFADMMLCDRADLSFGDYLDTVDASIKSLSF